MFFYSFCREFKIQCKGVGVLPPLDLSHQVIHFAATSLYDVSTAGLHVINSHTSMNEFTHPVPRIGKGFDPTSLYIFLTISVIDPLLKVMEKVIE
jgi:hypothetical protein